MVEHQLVHTTMVIVSNVCNCCSNDNSFTVPWYFPSLSSFSFLKGEKVSKTCQLTFSFFFLKSERVLTSINMWLRHTKTAVVSLCQLTDTMFVCTVFPQLIPHPRLVLQCGTIQIQTTLNSMFISIVTHPRIIPHDSMKNRILLLKTIKSLNSLLNKAQVSCHAVN